MPSKQLSLGPLLQLRLPTPQNTAVACCSRLNCLLGCAWDALMVTARKAGLSGRKLVNGSPAAHTAWRREGSLVYYPLIGMYAYERAGRPIEHSKLHFVPAAPT